MKVSATIVMTDAANEFTGMAINGFRYRRSLAFSKCCRRIKYCRRVARIKHRHFPIKSITWSRSTASPLLIKTNWTMKECVSGRKNRSPHP